MAQATARKSQSTSVIPKARKVVAERTADIISGIFPDLNSGARDTSQQPRYSLLKVEAKQVADQRDAINRAIDSFEAPENLAAAAAALGMRPSETPVFLNLTPPAGVTNG